MSETLHAFTTTVPEWRPRVKPIDLAKATPEQLEALGQARARAIQDALLGSGEIDPQRVFLIAAEAKPAVDGKVRVELALK